jgi:hypothetical protein
MVPFGIGRLREFRCAKLQNLVCSLFLSLAYGHFPLMRFRRVRLHNRYLKIGLPILPSRVKLSSGWILRSGSR